jgi:L,D-transpeptidase-like protein
MSRNSVVLAALIAGIFSVSAADAAVLVTIDKSIQQMTVEVDGKPLYQWPVSTGKAGNYDTPSGKFKAFRMERDHFSKEWDDAPMPFSIFFTQKGHAIHGSNETKRLGTPASHGCVRLLPANAGKLFALVEKEGVLNTTVVLTGVTPSSAAAAVRPAAIRAAAVSAAAIRPAVGKSELLCAAAAAIRSAAAAIPVRAAALCRADADPGLSLSRRLLSRSLRRYPAPAAPQDPVSVLRADARLTAGRCGRRPLPQSRWSRAGYSS